MTNKSRQNITRYNCNIIKSSNKSFQTRILICDFLIYTFFTFYLATFTTTATTYASNDTKTSRSNFNF